MTYRRERLAGADAVFDAHPAARVGTAGQVGLLVSHSQCPSFARMESRRQVPALEPRKRRPSSKTTWNAKVESGVPLGQLTHGRKKSSNFAPLKFNRDGCHEERHTKKSQQVKSAIFVGRCDALTSVACGVGGVEPGGTSAFPPVVVACR